MADINLLPQELKPNKSVLIVAKKLQKASIILGSFLVLFFILVIGLRYYYSTKIKESLSHQMDLETQIKQMEDTEQRLVLVKDRIEKIILILKQGTISEEVDVVKKVSGILPEGVLIKEVSLNKDLVEITVTSSGLIGASQYINSITSMSGLKFVNLISFDFNPSIGYQIELNFAASSVFESASVI